MTALDSEAGVIQRSEYAMDGRNPCDSSVIMDDAPNRRRSTVSEEDESEAG